MKFVIQRKENSLSLYDNDLSNDNIFWLIIYLQTFDLGFIVGIYKKNFQNQLSNA